MNKIPFSKPSTTPEQQVQLLLSRGILIADPAAAVQYLTYHSYYYLSGYVYYFEIKHPGQRTHQLARPVSFQDIQTLINFDQRLREHCLNAVFAIEAALRCVIAHELAATYGPMGLQNPALFRSSVEHPKFVDKLYQALNERKNEPFVKHFSTKYQENIPPAWVMTESLTFGSISWLYSQLTSQLQKHIAQNFRVDHFILVSWLRSLTELRNTCAHHARLWNKVFVNYPKIRNADKAFRLLPGQHNRLGSFIPLIRHMLSVINQKGGWMEELNVLLTGNTLIRPEDMGLLEWEILRGEK